MVMSRTNRPLTIAVIALVIALLASASGTINSAIYAKRNCQKIELLKAHAYTAIKKNRDEMESGDLDKVFQRIYDDRWMKEKRAAIIEANKELDAFSPTECHLQIFWRK